MSSYNSKWRSDIEVVNKGVNLENINPSLFLDKYFLWQYMDGKIPTYQINKKNYKAIHFDKTTCIKLSIESKHYNYLRERKNRLPNAITFCLTTRKKMIINHGGESIFENSIALHPYYGFPVIPGSAIKGVARHYCEETISTERELIDEETANVIFGSDLSLNEMNKKGSIIFLDAWPKSLKENLSEFLERDIFTPHYPNYYQGTEVPIDNQDPSPVSFLAVSKDVEFEFVIAPALNCREKNMNEYCEKAKKAIIESLKYAGIGAKTGSDYGYLR